MRKMSATDYLNMDTNDLLGWWLYDQLTEINNPDAPEQISKMLAAYDAYGREGVAEILSTSEYMTDDNPTKLITLSSAKTLLSEMKNNGDARFFSAEFFKRTDGSFRKMRCRFGVTKLLKGGEKSYDDSEKQVFTVYDPDAKARYTKAEEEEYAMNPGKPRKPNGGYRAINLLELVRLTIGGVTYVIEENRDLIDLIK